jgi:hypothetical protein
MGGWYQRPWMHEVLGSVGESPRVSLGEHFTKATVGLRRQAVGARRVIETVLRKYRMAGKMGLGRGRIARPGRIFAFR